MQANGRHSMTLVTLLLSIVLAGTTAVLVPWLWPTCCTSWLVAAVALAAYLPSYCDGAENTVQGRTWPWFQRLGCWRWTLQAYAHAPTVISDIPAEFLQRKGAQVMLAVHPHGVLSTNHILFMTDCVGFLSKVVPLPRRDHIASILFAIPVVRELLLWLGNINVTGKMFHKTLAAGYSSYVYPGGEQEQLRTRPGLQHAFIKRRTGFLRIALQHRVPVVPIYVFGETDLVHASHACLGARLKLVKALRVAIPLFWCRRGCCGFRKGVRLTAVVGKPVPVPEGAPTDSREAVPAAVLASYHAAYMAELQRVFEAHKRAAGYPDAQLELQ